MLKKKIACHRLYNQWRFNILNVSYQEKLHGFQCSQKSDVHVYTVIGYVIPL